jgi:ribosomal protein L37AE/L43A
MSNVGMRIWTCNGCGYEDKQVGTYYKMKKSWDTIHTLDFCRARKIEMFPGTMDTLAKLSIMS